MRRLPLLLSALAMVALLVGCDGAATSSAVTTPSRAVTASPSTVSSPAAAPTSPAIPKRAPKTRGKAGSTCVNGWTTPPPGSPLFTEPLGIVRRTTGVQGPLEVVDMRTFTGPESPPSDKGYLLEIQRWYTKLYAVNDPAFQGRFLVESRRFGRGVAAVAPYDTSGFTSPDWVGFQYETEDRTPRTVAGLPGRWTGTAYDFVDGGEGIDLPGLPAEVVGCLDGT
jgi:hypothetical protein